MTSKVFLDTNILAYLYDSASPGKQAAARAAIGEDRDFVVSTQVLLELYVVLTRKLAPALPAERAAEIVGRAADLGVVNADRVLVEHAMTTASAHQLSVWDAMILDAASEAGCEELWTEDLAEVSALRGVTVVNPLRAPVQ